MNITAENDKWFQQAAFVFIFSIYFNFVADQKLNVI